MLAELENYSLSISELKKAECLDDMITSLLSGDAALFIDGKQIGYILGSRGWESRSIEEPANESCWCCGL
ncbi:spore germination protein [Priestia megaterium]|nr:spore germination protein [Priestia megaterium]